MKMDGILRQGQEQVFDCPEFRYGHDVWTGQGGVGECRYCECTVIRTRGNRWFRLAQHMIEEEP